MNDVILVVSFLCIIFLMLAVGCLYVDIQNIKDDTKDTKETLYNTVDCLEYCSNQINKLNNQSKELHSSLENESEHNRFVSVEVDRINNFTNIFNAKVIKNSIRITSEGYFIYTKMDFDNTTTSMSIPMSSIKSIFIYKEEN